MIKHLETKGAVEASTNIDTETVSAFGDEWSTYDQAALDEAEALEIFSQYFGIFPWEGLPADAEGFDMGCGSGRWSKLVAHRVGRLHCIDASEAALSACQRNLAGFRNIEFHHAATDGAPLAPESQDFGFSLGVLHHIPDTEKALKDCVGYLRPGAPFLLYLYHRFDNRPGWYRLLWQISERLRFRISRLPPRIKSRITDAIALFVYWPLARLSWLGEKLGVKVRNMPLYAYRNMSFFTMRTDSRDRFGTPLEQRFTRQEIQDMMNRASLNNVRFSEHEPYWCAVGIKV